MCPSRNLQYSQWCPKNIHQRVSPSNTCQWRNYQINIYIYSRGLHTPAVTLPCHSFLNFRILDYFCVDCMLYHPLLIRWTHPVRIAHRFWEILQSLVHMLWSVPCIHVSINNQLYENFRLSLWGNDLVLRNSRHPYCSVSYFHHPGSNFYIIKLFSQIAEWNLITNFFMWDIQLNLNQ